MDINILSIAPVALFFLSLFGLIISKNIIKSIVLILVMQTAVAMAWLVTGSMLGTRPPIIYDLAFLENPAAIADPLPQALMITAIVVGIAVTATNIVMINSLLRKYNTAEWSEIHELAYNSENLADTDSVENLE